MQLAGIPPPPSAITHAYPTDGRMVRLLEHSWSCLQMDVEPTTFSYTTPTVYRFTTAPVLRRYENISIAVGQGK